MAKKKSKKSFKLNISRGWKIFLIVVGAIILINTAASAWFRYEEAQIEKLHASIAEGQDWELIGESTAGSRTCVKHVCPRYSKHYRISQLDDKNIKSFFSNIIQQEGYIITKEERYCNLAFTRSSQTSTYCSVQGEKDGLTLNISLNKPSKKEMKNGAKYIVSVTIAHKSYFWGLYKGYQ